MNEPTPAIKQILEGDDDLSPEIIEAEDEFSGSVRDWLREQADRIAFASSNGLEPTSDFWGEELTLLAGFLGAFLLKWVGDAIGSIVDRLRPTGLGVTDLVNVEAEKWAARHALRLARGLNRTTRQMARQRIALWIRSGSRDQQALVSSLNEIISPTWRAEMIAQTEITRAYGEAHRAVADKVDGVKTIIWHTRLDERVCPICSPLHGVKLGRDGTFRGFRSPPAHPRCRCTLDIELDERQRR